MGQSKRTFSPGPGWDLYPPLRHEMRYTRPHGVTLIETQMSQRELAKPLEQACNASLRHRDRECDSCPPRGRL